MFPLVALMLLAASCTQQSVGQSLSKAERHSLEDKVANEFEGIRRDAKLRPLSRIKHREQLEKEACTVSVVSTEAIDNHLPFRFYYLLYRTIDPTLPTPELRQIASFESYVAKQPANVKRIIEDSTHELTRYSIAVWRKDQSDYVVGVRLYYPAELEWLDKHLTDDAFYKNDWKDHIAPECRSIDWR